MTDEQINEILAAAHVVEPPIGFDDYDLKVARAILAAAPQSSPWQPMATAPKDKALILYCSHMYEIGHFNTFFDAWLTSDHRPIKPTQWQPLPPKPAANIG